MPTDMMGKHRPNSQAVMHADKMSAMRKPKPTATDTEGGEGESGGSSLHEHGDGSYHTMIDGTKTEHPSIGHALMHLAAHHEPEGAHMHLHHDGMSIKSHHASDGGETEGPHEHESGQEAGQHAAQVMDGEGGGEHGMPGGEDGSSAGFSAMIG